MNGESKSPAKGRTARRRRITLLNRLEFALALTLGAFFRLVGVDAASAISGGFTRFIGPKLKGLSNRARRNLQIAFPDMEKAEQDAIIRDVWENLGRTAAEFAHLDKFNPDTDNPRLEIIGREKIYGLAESGGPALCVSGHFANWELMAVALNAAGVKNAIIYRAANNPLLDALIIKERGRVMSRRQIAKGKRGGREMIDAVKSGATIAMLIDQKLTTGGVASPFFGKPAMTAPAAARLALKYDAPIYIGRIERLLGAHFRLTVSDPVAFEPSGDMNADIQSLTDRLNLEIEKLVRANPGQWLWLHRRWPKEEYRRRD
ncbi:MAG: lysophospholipid acyltransferase family protein [Parvularculaceae bacterium]